uniref:Acyl-CoA synthetase long chain family member 1 n=1 Tax=Canis lupus dingo TaxID=286419 RepID=A0A8C0JN94_CANLU
MQAHELFRYFRMPELADFRQYVRTLPTNTLMGFGAFAAITTFWYATRPRALKPPCDLSMQSVEVAGSDGARRSPLLDSDEPLVYFYDDVRTIYEGFQRGIQVSSKHLLNLCDECLMIFIQNKWSFLRKSFAFIFHLLPPVQVPLSPPQTSPE